MLCNNSCSLHVFISKFFQCITSCCFLLVIGFYHYFSTVNVEQLAYNYYNPYNSSYSNSSKAKWSLAYGAAAGIDIPLNQRDDLGLEIKCAYVIGSNTNYLTNPRIDNNGEVFFSEEESSTTMVIPQIGIRLNIK